MTSVQFTRHGTWWVTATDGRSIQRTGRDTLTYQEPGGRTYRLEVEISSPGIAVFRNAVTALDGWNLNAEERQAVFQRALQLLDASGDPYTVD